MKPRKPQDKLVASLSAISQVEVDFIRLVQLALQ